MATKPMPACGPPTTSTVYVRFAGEVYTEPSAGLLTVALGTNRKSARVKGFEQVLLSRHVKTALPGDTPKSAPSSVQTKQVSAREHSG
jgi:hypothetical protein